MSMASVARRRGDLARAGSVRGGARGLVGRTGAAQRPQRPSRVSPPRSRRRRDARAGVVVVERGGPGAEQPLGRTGAALGEIRLAPRHRRRLEAIVESSGIAIRTEAVARYRVGPLVLPAPLASAAGAGAGCRRAGGRSRAPGVPPQARPRRRNADHAGSARPRSAASASPSSPHAPLRACVSALRAPRCTAGARASSSRRARGRVGAAGARPGGRACADRARSSSHAPRRRTEPVPSSLAPAGEPSPAGPRR